MGNKFREKVVEEGLVEQRVESGERRAESGAPTDLRTDSPEGEQQTEQPKRGRGRGAKAARGVASVLGGDILADRMVVRQIPLLLLCIAYLLLIVGNRYRIESLSRELQASEERINFLREQRIQMQKQYQQSVKISQIADDLSDRGVGITAGPPYQL